jgi:DmsE family decaheme c-type cytochrome
MLAAMLAAQAAPQAASKTPAAQAATPAAPASPYAGSDTCQACHEDIYGSIAKSAHHIVDVEEHRGWKGRVCESCHGPGAKHAESVSPADIRNPGKLPAIQTDQICLKCHVNEPTHVGRLESSHAKNDVSCTACHKVHANGPLGLVKRTPTDINGQCSSCHLSERAQFNKPYHHRLPEEAMSCTDCHNPHGSIRRAMLQIYDGNEPGCLKCHGDKRGPFTFEHAPVRFEGCQSCHEPHGSTNPRMLTRQEVRFTCLQCHANLPSQLNTNAKMGVVPPAFHNLTLPLYQNCTVCHQKVHGSYVDRNLLR